MKYLLAFAIAVLTPYAALAVTIDLVPVGNPSNQSDQQGTGLFGRVTTSYQIGKTEVTNAQYLDFLNAKAASDPYGLYNSAMGRFEGGIIQQGSAGAYTYTLKSPVTGGAPGGTDYTYGDKPVVYVSWYDAIRFANWMNNGQGSGDTETGAYTLAGGTPIPSNAASITRNANATWFLPTENEWYKAAYYNPATSSYYAYPTSSNAAPDNGVPTADTGNSANYLIDTTTTTGDPSLPYTTAGGYALTHSPYGTFDQAGNVAEWNETLVSSSPVTRGARGGAWDTVATSLSAANRGTLSSASENDDTGFRLARIATVAGLPGDYNGNGVVDMADYVIWRDHLGTSFQLANEVAGTTPGTVTQEDYTAWRARFGNTSGAGTGASLQGASVPEPGSVLLAATATCVVVSTLRRRSRRAAICGC
ncbi:MAG TPA: SUMF1/EgtB/PvdO family nonheme iron enzyme [Lacipirellulaceae bacterium]|nr:SUMF1/EgtB/PvdO family nonheme iron enzyme [Lacipirellulaceae bacterium]